MLSEVCELRASTCRGAWSEFTAQAQEDIIKAAVLQGDICSRLAFPVDNRTAKNPFSDRFDLRPGELTIWAGANGSGKSAIMNQLSISMLRQGHGVCIFSFEMSPVSTLTHLIRCAYGREITMDDVVKFFDWAEDLLWIYQPQGAARADYVMDAVFYAAHNLHCADVVVDNLMMLSSGGTTDSLLQSQKFVVQSLKEISTQTGSRIHLVAHTRKPAVGASQTKLSRYDIAGNSDITNLADNVVLVRRNFDKEREAIETPELRNSVEWDSDPDTLLVVDKQRETGELVQVRLWYDKISGRFCKDQSRKVEDLVPVLKERKE